MNGNYGFDRGFDTDIEEQIHHYLVRGFEEQLIEMKKELFCLARNIEALSIDVEHAHARLVPVVDMLKEKLPEEVELGNILDRICFNKVVETMVGIRLLRQSIAQLTNKVQELDTEALAMTPTRGQVTSMPSPSVMFGGSPSGAFQMEPPKAIAVIRTELERIRFRANDTYSTFTNMFTEEYKGD